jgi:Ca-activated chloride channel family protein
MLKDYARALPDYAKAIDATDVHLRTIAQYDRGNTLFRLGRIEDARDAYRETLRLEPDDRDAKFNLELVQALLDGRRNSQPPGGQTNAPGQSGSPGGTGAMGATGPGASGSPEPGQQPGTPTGEQGDPTTDQANPGQTPPDLKSALSDFRVGLTLDDALRVLTALDGQQRGIAQLIEGPRRADRQTPEY